MTNLGIEDGDVGYKALLLLTMVTMILTAVKLTIMLTITMMWTITAVLMTLTRMLPGS